MGTLILEELVNGVLVGSIYALVAVGLALIFGVLGVINFAQGEYFMLGAFIAWAASTFLHVPYPIAVLVAVVLSIALALLVSITVMERLVSRTFEIGVLATIGLSMIYQNGVQLLFGGTFKSFPGGWTSLIGFGGISVSVQRLVIFIVTVTAFIVLELMIRKTRLGKAMRAVSQNYEACLVVGLDVNKIVRYTFMLGIGLAGLAGALLGPVVLTIYPGIGQPFTIKAFAIIAIGGLGNMAGAFIGALMLGIVESFVVGFVGLGYRDAVAFIALVAILLWRPRGLFGTRVRA